MQRSDSLHSLRPLALFMGQLTIFAHSFMGQWKFMCSRCKHDQKGTIAFVFVTFPCRNFSKVQDQASGKRKIAFWIVVIETDENISQNQLNTGLTIYEGVVSRKS